MNDLSRRRWISTTALAGLTMTGAAVVPSLSVPGAAPVQHGLAARQRFARNVVEFGATGNGVTDDTAAFQKALDTVRGAGGGIVHVPAGHYMLAGSVEVPPDTAIEGVFRGPISHGLQGESILAKPGAGSVILATGGRGSEDRTALISLATDAALVGVSIYYPEQNWQSTPVAYPWTIHLKGNNCTVENVELVNPWRGIKAVRAHRHLIRNVTGQPLKTGIFVDEVYDIGRIEDVHFNPWWHNSRPVLEFMYRHGESFVFGRTDWEYVLNTFSFGYHAGYRFMEGKTGACNGNFLGIGADASWHACLVEQSQDPGLLITNGEFVSFDYLKLGGEVDPIQVLVKSPNRGPVRFVNCSFWGPCRQISKLESASTLGFGDCTFCQWDQDLPALAAQDGNLLVHGCEFRQASRQIALGPNVQQAVISGNMTKGKWRIINESRADVQIGLNSGSS
ncbi:MAG: glycosyl hydrolase family 28-related protein [Phycisphaerae bacterium]